MNNINTENSIGFGAYVLMAAFVSGSSETRILNSSSGYTTRIQKLIQDIQVGDVVLSLNMPNKTDADWTSFTTGSVSGIETIENTVIRLIHAKINDYYILNEYIQATPSHYFFIKRDNIWCWKKASELLVNDLFLNSRLTEYSLTSIRHIEGLEDCRLNGENHHPESSTHVISLTTNNNNSCIVGDYYNSLNRPAS